MGDISMMWPTVEIGTAGFSGTIHGKDFKTSDEEQAYVFRHVFCGHGEELLSEGERRLEDQGGFPPIMTRETYLQTLDSLNKSTNFVYSKGE